MTGWLIFAGFLCLLALFLFMKLTIAVSYVGDLEVFIKIAFFKIRVYPGKEKETTPTPTTQHKPKTIKKKKKEPKPPRKKPDLRELLELIRDLIVEIVSKFGRYIRLEDYRVKLLVATGDPATTGILYGAASGILGSITHLLSRIKSRPRNKDFFSCEVTPDFLADQPDLFISLALSMRVWHFFSLGISGARGFLTYLSMTKPDKGKEKEDEQRNALKTDH